MKLNYLCLWTLYAYNPRPMYALNVIPDCVGNAHKLCMRRWVCVCSRLALQRKWMVLLFERYPCYDVMTQKLKLFKNINIRNRCFLHRQSICSTQYYYYNNLLQFHCSNLRDIITFQCYLLSLKWIIVTLVTN